LEGKKIGWVVEFKRFFVNIFENYYFGMFKKVEKNKKVEKLINIF
jgi:hypothetical protein